MTDHIKALVDALEPAAAAFATARPAISRTERAAYSQAISLKRIADALERLAAPITGLAPAGWNTVAETVVSTTPFPTLRTDADADADADAYIIDRRPARKQPAQRTDDWTSWNGGECPVPASTLVDVRVRDGQELYGVKARGSVYTYSAIGNCWRHDNLSNDIVAWRLAR